MYINIETHQILLYTISFAKSTHTTLIRIRHIIHVKYRKLSTLSKYIYLLFYENNNIKIISICLNATINCIRRRQVCVAFLREET